MILKCVKKQCIHLKEEEDQEVNVSTYEVFLHSRHYIHIFTSFFNNNNTLSDSPVRDNGPTCSNYILYPAYEVTSLSFSSFYLPPKIYPTYNIALCPYYLSQSFSSKKAYVYKSNTFAIFQLIMTRVVLKNYVLGTACYKLNNDKLIGLCLSIILRISGFPIETIFQDPNVHLTGDA